MEIIIKENGRIIQRMEMDFMCSNQGQNMKGSGRMMFIMEKVYFNIWMVIDLMDFSIMEQKPIEE